MRAASFQEFWHRWHITLSRWLRDYLYIPLGGSRTGRTSFNLMLTMLLGGLWHGNAAGFVAWGFLHGAGLSIERVFPKARGTRSWWAVTQISVMLAWIPFRLPSWDAASDFVVELFSSTPGKPAASVAFALVFALPVIAHQFLPLLIDRIGHRKLPLYLGAMTGVLLIFDLTISTSGRVFLYFSF
jgi:alginate O-acetyltransferase complex protein AlgI